MRNKVRWWFERQEWWPRPWRAVKWFVQRGRRGWSDRDVWNFDHYLASVIVGGLKQLEEHRHGYPSELAFKHMAHPDEPWRVTEEESEAGSKEYSEILEKIIYGFEVMLKDDWWHLTPEGEENADAGTWARESPVIEEALDLFRYWFNSFWD